MVARLIFITLFLIFPLHLFSQGEVYLVLGSDTGIWEGLDVNRHYHTYKLGLYTDPTRNAYKVMDPLFRNQMKDSYGTSLKMTWWMMSGNTFRYSVNKNVPHTNSLPIHLMKKYHGANVNLIGDELSLHYHNWVWTDYDQDGKYFWNQAKKGIDQVVCIWAHLPEEDFLTNIKRVDSVAQKSAAAYPDVKFRYCTGVEAYQRWLKTTDLTPPVINLIEETSGEETYYSVQVDGPIFQTFPFLAVKDLYDNYYALQMQLIGNNLWKSISPVQKSLMVKIGVAVTDTSGNLSTKIVKYLPDDIFIDNADPAYQEVYGNWTSSTNSSWGNDCRSVSLNPTDSALVIFSQVIPQTGKYNVFLQSPVISNPQPEVTIIAKENGTNIFEKKLINSLVTNDWNFIGTISPSAGSNLSIEIKLKGNGTSITNFSADVIKISSMVREREISALPKIIEFGSFSADDSASAVLTIENKGISELTIFAISSASTHVIFNETLPIKIPGMESRTMQLKFVATGLGPKSDTLFIQSDDSKTPLLSVPCTANIELPFAIVDNETADSYFESGEWFTSVAQAYGSSSRYSYLNQTPKSSAVFSTVLKHSGLYDIFGIVPLTVNASNKAYYILSVNGVPKDSVYVDQNLGSGNWRKIISAELPKDVLIELKVSDTGLNTNTNAVLRADAVKFSLISA